MVPARLVSERALRQYFTGSFDMVLYVPYDRRERRKGVNYACDDDDDSQSDFVWGCSRRTKTVSSVLFETFT